MPARLQSTAAQRTADPAGSAQRDFTFHTLDGDYRKAFPSLHTWHDLTPSLKVRASYSTGEYISSFNANLALRLYRESFKTVNVGLANQLRPELGLTLDVANVLNEPQVLYRGFKGRTQQTLYNFITITAGVNGRF